MAKTRLTLRIDWSDGRALGPGKIRLLQEIDKCGSISQAGRNLGISYHRAWLLIDDVNICFYGPVIETQTGGLDGGGGC
jgi:molybdate transport system regulatory protein